MKTFIKPVLVLLSALVLVCQVVQAEAPNTRAKVDIKLQRPIAIDSPMIGPGSRDVSFRPKSWMFLEAKMNVQALPVPKTGYLDQMSVKFYVAAKNPEGRDSILISKEIKYVNIPVTNDIYVCVFMSPSSIKRLTGSETVGSSMFTRIGVEVLYNGQVVGMDSRPGRPGWWKVPSPSLVPTSSYPLLSKNETPFAMFWYDRYPEIAPLREDSSSGSSATGPSPATPVAPAAPVVPSAN